MTEVAYELYVHPKEEDRCRITGSALKSHLEENSLVNRIASFSIEDDTIKGWRANPSTYPEEFRDKAVLLWTPNATYMGEYIFYLCWSRDWTGKEEVLVFSIWLEDVFVWCRDIATLLVNPDLAKLN